MTCTGDLTLGDLELKFLHDAWKKCQIRYVKFGGAARRRFLLSTYEKPEGGGTKLNTNAVRVLRSASDLTVDNFTSNFSVIAEN